MSPKRLTEEYPFLLESQHLADDVCNSLDADDAYRTLMQLSEPLNSEQPLLRFLFRASAANAVAGKKLLTSPPSYVDAIQYYTIAASYILGYSYSDRMELHLLDSNSLETYRDIFRDSDPGSSPSFLFLASFLNQIAYCWMKLGDNVRAIDWMQEVDLLYRLHSERIAKSGYPWDQQHIIKVQEFSDIGVLYRRRLSDIFCSLGNTATAAHIGLSVNVFAVRFKYSEKIEGYQDLAEYNKLMNKRHPDFKDAEKADTISTELRLRGHWNRIHAKGGRKPPLRVGVSSWIWRSRLYVYGGRKFVGFEFHTDLWCLDLRTMKSWRQLPSSPLSNYTCTVPIAETKMCVWDDTAWLFVGQLVVFKFDLNTEKWVSVETRWNCKEPWPYKANLTMGFCAEVFEGKLHIFGGNDGFDSAGLNLHMSLDLKTLQWTKLGGTTVPEKLIKGMPSIRKGAASWVVPEERRMFILYGFASPSHDKTHHHDEDHSEFQHEDMWSYSFDSQSWRRERLRGSLPCPRTRMACAYHPKQQQVVVFGGIALQLPTVDQDYSQKAMSYTPLADTFVFDVKTRIWKQVLTSNFPHHRASAEVNVDQDTGKIYLLGGMCSAVYMPSSKNTDASDGIVCLGDLWQLDFELSGTETTNHGCSVEKQVNRFGPWMLCFGCGSYKVGIFACGGTCGGRIFLCSVDCQRKSWKTHKRLHICRRF